MTLIEVGFLLVIFFFAVAGLGYGLIYSIAGLISFGRPQVFMTLNKLGMHVYTVMLMLPLFFVFKGSASYENMGLALPKLFNLNPVASLLISIVLGAIVGIVIYQGEELLAQGVGKLAEKREDLYPKKIMEGKSQSIMQTMPAGGFGAVAILGIVIVMAEEFLWRGFLQGYLMDTYALSWWVALLVAAASFGLNHAYFGLRNVITKTLSGIIWGGLFLLTSSVLTSFVSHLVFNALAAGLVIELEES